MTAISLMHFFCSAGRGTEKFAAIEIEKKLNGKDIQVTDGKIFFRTDVSNLKAIGQLRSVERAFAQVLCHTELDGVKTVKDIGRLVLSKDLWINPDLTDLASRIHQSLQEDYQPPEKRHHVDEETKITFRVSSKCAGKIGRRIQPMMLSKYIGCGLQRQMNWKVDLRNPSLEVCIHVNDNRMTVGIPVQSCPLSKRHYIRHFGLRGTVAWIMADLLEIQECDVVLDPMCGKSTLLVEACHHFRNATYLGIDKCTEQLSKAVENLQWSRLQGNIGLVHGDAKKLPLISNSVDRVICDAPFGQNFIPDTNNISEFYRQTLTEMSRVLRPRGRLVLLTSHQLSQQVCALWNLSGDNGDDTNKNRTLDKISTETRHNTTCGTAMVEKNIPADVNDISTTMKNPHLKEDSKLKDEESGTSGGHSSSNLILGDKKDDEIAQTFICTTVSDKKSGVYEVPNLSELGSLSTGNHGNITVTTSAEVLVSKDYQSDLINTNKLDVIKSDQLPDNTQTSECEFGQDLGATQVHTLQLPDGGTDSWIHLKKLKFIASHYIKLGETDASICVFGKETVT